MDKQILVTSFSFRHGIPAGANLVFDARFLQNPYWSPVLQPLTGLDEHVGEYIEQDPDFEGFVSHIQGLTTILLPRFFKEDRPLLTIAIGCTGGQHRSVYTTEKISKWLISQNHSVQTHHRELAAILGK